MVVGARRIRSEKLREDQYREGYIRSVEGKKVGGDNNANYMFGQVKGQWLKVREVCGSMRVGDRNQGVCGGSLQRRKGRA